MIQLPTLCGTRESAEQLFVDAPRETSLVISLEGVQAIAQGYADELCKQLVDRRIDVVTFLKPSDRFLEYFLRAHRLRSAKFMVSWRE